MEPVDQRDRDYTYAKGAVPEHWYPNPDDAPDPINKRVAEDDDEKE